MVSCFPRFPKIPRLNVKPPPGGERWDKRWAGAWSNRSPADTVQSDKTAVFYQEYFILATDMLAAMLAIELHNKWEVTTVKVAINQKKGNNSEWPADQKCIQNKVCSLRKLKVWILTHFTQLIPAPHACFPISLSNSIWQISGQSGSHHL